MKYEYKFFARNFNNRENEIRELNELGKSGWRVLFKDDKEYFLERAWKS